MSHSPDDPRHWASHMRRCPSEGCQGVVDDELETPCCCSCGRKLPDGPEGPLALPAPDGAEFQEDVLEGEPGEIRTDAGVGYRIERTLEQRAGPN